MYYKVTIYYKQGVYIMIYRNNFKQWLHENYIIQPNDTQEIYNILFSNRNLKDDIRTIVTYLNNQSIQTKLGLEPTIINGLGVIIIVYTLEQTPYKKLLNYLQFIKQPLKTSDKVEFLIKPLETKKYNFLRTRNHHKTTVKVY